MKKSFAIIALSTFWFIFSGFTSINMKTFDSCPNKYTKTCETIPIQLEIKDTDGLGKASVFIENNESPLAVKFEFNEEQENCFISFRVRLQESSKIKLIYTDKTGKETIKENYITKYEKEIITIPENSNLYSDQIKIKYQNNELKFMSKSDMAKNNYWNKIEIIGDDTSLIKIYPTPNLSHNPYLHFKLNENYKNLEIIHTSVNDKSFSKKIQ